MCAGNECALAFNIPVFECVEIVLSVESDINGLVPLSGIPVRLGASGVKTNENHACAISGNFSRVEVCAFYLSENNPLISASAAKYPSCEPSFVRCPFACCKVNSNSGSGINRINNRIINRRICDSFFSCFESFVSSFAYPVVKTSVNKVSCLVCAIVEDNLKACYGSIDGDRVPAVLTFNSSHSCAGPLCNGCICTVQCVPSVKIYVCPRSCVVVKSDFGRIFGNNRISRFFTLCCDCKSTKSSYSNCVSAIINNLDVTIGSCFLEVSVACNVRSVELNTFSPVCIRDLEAIACSKCKSNRSIAVFVNNKSIFRSCSPSVHSTTNVPSCAAGRGAAITGLNDFAILIKNCACEATGQNIVNDLINTSLKKEVVITVVTNVCIVVQIIDFKSCAVCTNFCICPAAVHIFCDLDCDIPVAVAIVVERPVTAIFEPSSPFIECTCEVKLGIGCRSIGRIKEFNKFPSNEVLRSIIRICCVCDLVDTVLTISKSDVPSSEVSVVFVLRSFKNSHA